MQLYMYGALKTKKVQGKPTPDLLTGSLGLLGKLGWGVSCRRASVGKLHSRPDFVQQAESQFYIPQWLKNSERRVIFATHENS